jgi:hypothetical protein
MRQISESDWKRFHRLQSLALERFCQRILAEVSQLVSVSGKSNHEQYLAVFELIQRRDKELAEVFDNPRRSTALLQLALLWVWGLLTAEEFAGFSVETREAVQEFQKS